MSGTTSDDVSRLSPAAKSLLEELQAEMRTEVLDRALRRATDSYGEVGEVSVRDLRLAIDDYRYGRTPQLRRRRQIEVGLLGYTVLGLVMVFGAVTFILVRRLGSVLDNPEGQALLVAFVGSAVLAFSTLGLVLLRWAGPTKSLANRGSDRDLAMSTHEDGRFRLLRAWLDLETTLRELASLRLDVDEEARKSSPAALLRSLSSAGVLTEHQVAAIRELLEIRNRVAHSDADKDIDYDAMVDKARALTRNLRRLLVK